MKEAFWNFLGTVFIIAVGIVTNLENRWKKLFLKPCPECGSKELYISRVMETNYIICMECEHNFQRPVE